MRLAKAPTALTLLLLWATSSVHAEQVPSWQQCSEARVEALGFIEVATASLWRANCGEIDLSPPLRLQFDYSRSVPGEAMAKAAMAMVERNISEALFETLGERLQNFSDRFEDIARGDRYELLYLEDGQVEMRLNGELLAGEQGHQFANAYLQIWFGPKPYSRDMKRSLLRAAR